MDFVEGEVLLFDKGLTWTSFDIVNKLRYLIKKQLNIKNIKVGHAGTLDPLATGLLIVCTGKKTKMIDTYQAQTKEYAATLKIGATTPSFDRESEEDSSYPTDHITKELIQKVLAQFIGEQDQVPPIFSAKKIDGKKAYEIARKGKEIELKPNRIVIYELELVSYQPPLLGIRVVCGKGTYIRSLARDIGVALNSGAYLHDLRRTKIGEYLVENAYEILEFEKIIKNLQPT
ncbi:MAG: tRNA pseudouridine(55) synthase TruB [Salinivirgaceae bacterium]|nr:tRNA pseudouridine(55) synthase TruB [Salinivirgaceae bacterium]